jgi:hypothetical protein
LGVGVRVYFLRCCLGLLEAGLSDRKDRECDRAMREEENERRGERERRGEQLREAWRQRHPERAEDKGRPKKGGRRERTR